MSSRLAYREFIDVFLLHFAILTQADTSKFIDPIEVAGIIEDRFQQSWIASATKDLRDEAYLSGRTFLGSGGSYSLTGPGLLRAEEIAAEIGSDLYELIDERFSTPLVTETGEVITDEAGNAITVTLPQADRIDIVAIDHMSQAWRDLDEQMAITIREIRSSNSIMNDGGAEASQRVAELEAGKVLLKADQADKTLVKRLLLPALNYLGRTVTDETVKAGIQKLISLVVAHFS